MPYFILGLSLILYGLSLNPSALADEILPIAKIMERPADYQAKVVIVEGRASDVTELPPRFRVHRCAGGPVYDAQLFMLQDQSGPFRSEWPGPASRTRCNRLSRTNVCASVESWSRMKRIL